MNIQILSNTSELTNPLISFFTEKKGVAHQQTNIQDFFKSCIRKPSNLFILQADISTEIEVLDFIKDLRMYFGAFPSILIIGKKHNLSNITNYLNVGADKVLSFPYDFGILEDFLGKNLQRDIFLPIDYRTVPSGGIPVEITRPISLKQISSEGISFETVDFLTRGTIFDFNLNGLLDISRPDIKCKVISSSRNEENDVYQFFAEYYEIPDDIRKEIRFNLKK